MLDTTSLWQDTVIRKKNYSALTHDIEVDVAIVGGGITGVTAAEQLIKQGKKVVILESAKIGGVTTGLSTGNLYVAVQPYYQHIQAKL